MPNEGNCLDAKIITMTTSSTLPTFVGHILISSVVQHTVGKRMNNTYCPNAHHMSWFHLLYEYWIREITTSCVLFTIMLGASSYHFVWYEDETTISFSSWTFSLNGRAFNIVLFLALWSTFVVMHMSVILQSNITPLVPHKRHHCSLLHTKATPPLCSMPQGLTPRAKKNLPYYFFDCGCACNSSVFPSPIRLVDLTVRLMGKYDTTCRMCMAWMHPSLPCTSFLCKCQIAITSHA